VKLANHHQYKIVVTNRTQVVSELLITGKQQRTGLGRKDCSQPSPSILKNSLSKTCQIPPTSSLVALLNRVCQPADLWPPVRSVVNLFPQHIQKEKPGRLALRGNEHLDLTRKRPEHPVSFSHGNHKATFMVRQARNING